MLGSVFDSYEKVREITDKWDTAFEDIITSFDYKPFGQSKKRVETKHIDYEQKVKYLEELTNYTQNSSSMEDILQSITDLNTKIRHSNSVED